MGGKRAGAEIGPAHSCVRERGCQWSRTDDGVLPLHVLVEIGV